MNSKGLLDRPELLLRRTKRRIRFSGPWERKDALICADGAPEPPACSEITNRYALGPREDGLARADAVAAATAHSLWRERFGGRVGTCFASMMHMCPSGYQVS